MHRGLARNTHEVSVQGDSGDPGQPLSGEDQRPRVAFLSRNARVDQDVLQLARAPAAYRPHAETGAAKSNLNLHSWSQVRHAGIVAARATFDVEPGLGAGDRGCDDFHVVAHDTKTSTSRKIYASTARSAPHEGQHRGEVRSRERGLRTSGA